MKAHLFLHLSEKDINKKINLMNEQNSCNTSNSEAGMVVLAKEWLPAGNPTEIPFRRSGPLEKILLRNAS